MVSALAALLWLIAANAVALMPTRDHHWRAAYFLIATAIPLTVWLLVTHGAFPAGAFALAAASILRWPLILAWRRLRRTRDLQ